MSAARRPLRRIALGAGTPEIARPLARSLARSLAEPVVVLPLAGDPCADERTLARLAAEGELWLLPSDERELLALDAAVLALPAELRAAVRTPGTARRGRVRPRELCDKGNLQWLLGPEPLAHSRRLATSVWRRGARMPDDLAFPLVVKPASKDAEDSFTHAHPAKLVLVDTEAELRAAADALPRACRERDLVLQELSTGRPVSWCGWSAGGETGGHAIHAEVKTPSGPIGGTTTLARIEPADERLALAAAEIAQRLELDGVFEIEFLLDPDGTPAFICEINPRPWLQVALVLGREPDPFVEYFAHHGFTRAAPGAWPTSPARSTWGSAAWYLRRTPRDQALSLRTLGRALRHDVVFTEGFTLRERLSYLGRLAAKLVRRRRLATGASEVRAPSRQRRAA